jgi:outer membrane receptor protein involved in Fe transport
LLPDAIRRLTLGFWTAAAVAALSPGLALAQSATDAPQPTAKASSPPPASTDKSKTAPTKVKEITVTAREDKIKSSPDSRSYDITHDPQAATGSVADVLRNVPSVGVSPDGAVSLRGDTSVVIYVDGKPSALFKGPDAGQALQSMPADQYERVEVMTNPSAAYAPDGAAGIINLVSKKTKKPGRWGSFKVSEGTAGRSNASLNATQRTDELTLSFFAGVRHDRGGSTSGDERETLDGSNDVESTLQTAGRGQNGGHSAYAGGSAEWNPNKHDQITAELGGWTFGGDSSNTTRYATDDPQGDVTGLIQRDGRGDYHGSGVWSSLTWRRTFDSNEHNLTVSLSHDIGINTNLSLADQANVTPAAPDTFDHLRRGGAQPDTELKVDYVRPMPLEGVLKAGLDFRDESSRTDNSGFLQAASADAPNAPGQTDLFRFDRRVDAVYTTYNQPIGRLSVLLGLRLEDARTSLDDETTSTTGVIDNLSLYPTLHLGWKLTEHQKLTASFTERVQRPGANQYDPFRFISGPYNENQGNSDLKPEQSRKYELGWEYKAGGAYYSATAYYKHSDDGVASVVTDLGDGVFLTTPENLSRSQNAGLELIASGHLTSTLSYNLSGNQRWIQIDVMTAGFTPQAGWTFAGHGSLDWQATPNDLVQVQGAVNGRQVTPQGFSDTGPLVNLGYRRKFDNRLALQLTAQDAFGQAYNTYASNSPAVFDDAGSRKIHDRVAYASLIWTFGRGPKKAPDPDPGQDFTPPTGG